MALDIELKIYMPEKLVLSERVHRVVLPTGGKTLTVLKDRAPTLVSLDMGSLVILDEDDKPVAEWYVSGGVANVVGDSCTVLSEAAYNKSELSYEIVKAMNEEFANPFFEWLLGKMS